MRTRIISAFPGTGKSYYHKENLDTTLDSDSSQFQWLESSDAGSRDGKVRTPNPDFPDNYMDHIQESIGKYEFIFVSSHKVVREALLKRCIHFYLIYPRSGRKLEYINRYRQRGDAESFIDRISENWINWIYTCRLAEIGCTNISMHHDNITEEIQRILAIENSPGVS